MLVIRIAAIWHRRSAVLPVSNHVIDHVYACFLMAFTQRVFTFSQWFRENVTYSDSKVKYEYRRNGSQSPRCDGVSHLNRCRYALRLHH